MKSSQAQAASAIRKELKANFPGTKFSVTSESFSMGDAVRISWIDGQTTDMVDSIVKKYQYGSFNGMEDMYENTNNRDDIPQSKYVQTGRRMSAETKAKIAALPELGWAEPQSYSYDSAIYRVFAKTAF